MENHTDITETPTISNYKFLVLSLRCFYLFFSGVYLKLSLRELIECVEKPEQRHRINMDALAYIRKKGVTVDRFYPGMKKKEGCRRVDMNPTRSIRDYHLLVPNDEENLKIAVATIGPISVSIRVTGNFFFYKTGIFYDKECGSATQEINHAVLLVGYGKVPIGGDYWIIKNKWGSHWREYGFARIARNSFFNCGIASAAIFADK